jgi:hypothetical protein
MRRRRRWRSYDDALVKNGNTYRCRLVEPGKKTQYFQLLNLNGLRGTTSGVRSWRAKFQVFAFQDPVMIWMRKDWAEWRALLQANFGGGK